MAADPTHAAPVPASVESHSPSGKPGELGKTPPGEGVAPLLPGEATAGFTPVSPVSPVSPVPLDPEIAQWVTTLDDDAREFFEERAGIREFDGGIPRKDAEAEAQQDVLRWLRQHR
jgi:hypothetical protein